MIGGRQRVGDAQVWIATAPVDMRKSFDSLAEVVRSFLGARSTRWRPGSGSLGGPW